MNTKRFTADDSEAEMTLGLFSDPKLLVPRLLSRWQEDALQELTRRLESAGCIENGAGFLATVSERESETPTLVGHGVVIPHVRGTAVQRLSLAVGISQNGIGWGSDRRHEIQVIFLFALPFNAVPVYHRLLTATASFIQDQHSFDSLKNARQPEEMLGVLNSVFISD